MSDALEILKQVILSAWQVIKWVWWIVIPYLLFSAIYKLWLEYIKKQFLKKVEYVVFEIKVPRYVEKSFKSMENVFASLHSIQISKPNFKERVFEGKTQLWLSAEIVGNGEGVSFYFRTPKDYKNLVESHLYAQYPDVEINEVEDYTSVFSAPLPNKFWDLWGLDFMLTQPSPYPILTYPFFELQKEEKIIDPLASLLETVSKLGPDEKIWVQILFKPADDSCKKEGEKIVGKLIGKKEPTQRSYFDYVLEFLYHLVRAPFTAPQWWEDSGSAGSPGNVQNLTPGEKEIVEAIQRKTSKLLFDATIRFVYIDRRDAFTRLNITSVMGFFRQFNTLHLNGFKPYKPSVTKANKPFKEQKEFWKKRVLFKNYLKRKFNGDTKMVLNTEELATLFHFPVTTVEAPMLKRLEAKKSGPPINLPTEK